MPYDYVDIREDEAGRLRVKEINDGNESVPTLVFGDGSTLTEPSSAVLFSHLESMGQDFAPQTTSDRLFILLGNPLISAFGMGLGIVGWMVDSLPVIILGFFLIVLPIVVRNFRK